MTTLCKIFPFRQFLFAAVLAGFALPHGPVSAAAPAKTTQTKKQLQAGVLKKELARQSDVIIAEMLNALAGEEHWKNIHFLRFDFSFEKSSQRAMWNQHLWDRATGDNRIEWRNESNAAVVVLFNEKTQVARAWVGSFEKTGAELAALAAEAQRRHMYDVVWLGAPFLLADKRANLKYEGTVNVDGQDYDIVHARFDGLGMLAGDHYWFYINQATHLVDRWAYFLKTSKGTPALKYAVAWRWKNWQNVGNGLIVSTERDRIDQDWKATFPIVSILGEDEIPLAVFTDVNVSMPKISPTGQ